MNDILNELQTLIEEFNSSNKSGFAIDTIRIDFSKEYKLEALKEIGQWVKIGKHSNILHKLKKRLHDAELTSAHRLKGYDVYYYNLQDPPKYRRARMVIFGMSQYHKDPTPESIIRRVLRILKEVTNIDVCIDFDRPPDLGKVGRYFTLRPYKGSIYINTPFIPMVERIIFYDKALKNGLSTPLWRMEAIVLIPNWKDLVLPLFELKEVTTLAWGNR